MNSSQVLHPKTAMMKLTGAGQLVKKYNQSSKLVLACPITSKIKRYPFEVRVKANKIDGVVLADQVKNLDWTTRDMSFVARAPYEVVEKTQELIETLLRD